jgi:hypothetical protein
MLSALIGTGKDLLHVFRTPEAVDSVADVRHRAALAAAGRDLEHVMAVLRPLGADSRWRGPAARAFARALDRRVDGLARARRALLDAEREWARADASSFGVIHG